MKLMDLIKLCIYNESFRVNYRKKGNNEQLTKILYTNELKALDYPCDEITDSKIESILNRGCCFEVDLEEIE